MVEDHILFGFLCQPVIDILKLNGFGIMIILREAHAILPNPLIWDGLLCAVQMIFAQIRLRSDGGNLLLFSPCEFSRLDGLLLSFPGQSF